MDHQSLDALEEKITRMISKMNKLKVENQELRQENKTLQTALNEKEQTIQQLHNKAEEISRVQGDIETYKQNQDRIRSKVEVLLHKLKEFEE
ncbi:cell division protein ZapB [bacterium]|nr:cell division protein ZapB [bacterium]